MSDTARVLSSKVIDIEKLKKKTIVVSYRRITWIGTEFTFDEYMEELGYPTGKDYIYAVQFFYNNYRKPVRVEDSEDFSQKNPDKCDNEITHVSCSAAKLRQKMKKEKQKYE